MKHTKQKCPRQANFRVANPKGKLKFDTFQALINFKYYMWAYLLISLVLFFYSLSNLTVVGNTCARKIQQPNGLCFTESQVYLIKKLCKNLSIYEKFI